MRKFYLRFLPVFLLITIVSSGHSFAQNAAGIGAENIKKEETFNKILGLVSQQYHVAFVCEGQPLSLTLKDEQYKKLTESLQKLNITREETITAIAEAFDYTAMPGSPTLYTLTKKYSLPADIPCVTFEEARIASAKIFEIVNQARPLDGFDSVVNLYNSLTESQKHPGPEGIVVSSLSSEQIQLARQVASSYALMRLGGIKVMTERLIRCPKVATFFGYHTAYQVTLPCYQVPVIEYPDSPDVVLLGRWLYTSSSGAISVFQGPNGVTFANEKLTIDKPDPTDPTVGDPLVPAARILAHPLSEIAEGFNQRLSKESSPVKTVEIEDALGRKPLYLVGENYASVPDLVKGIAEVYSLRFSRPTQNSLRIATPVARPITDPNQIKPEIYRLLPAPLSRIILRQGNSWDYYSAAVRRLRALIEPELAKRENKKISFAEVGEEVKDLVAISTLLTCAEDIRSIKDQTPSYLANLPNTRFSIIASPATRPGMVKLEYGMWSPIPGQTQGNSVSGRMEVNASQIKP